MKNINFIIISFFSFVVLASCKPELKSFSYETIRIDSTFDSSIDPEKQAYLDQYKSQLDSVMNRVIAVTNVELYKGKPQSPLSNYTADILVRAGRDKTQKPVSIAVVNNGGLRASINKGDVTVEDIFKVFPFENELVVLSLSGTDVMEFFKRMAAIGGEGLAGCELVVKDNKVQSLKIDGRPVDPNGEYWLATIDYLADGNSGMSVLLNAKERINVGERLRDVMLEYVEQDSVIQPELDERIVIKK